MSNTFTRVATRVMIVGALGVAVVFALKHGADKGATSWMQGAMIAGLVIVAIMEYLAWHNAACNWFERRLGAVLMWSTVGVALTAGTLYTNFSAGAGNNVHKAGLQLAAMTAQTDVGKAYDDAVKTVDRLEQRLKFEPVRTPEAARAAQDKAKAHRFWKTTDGCKETQGRDTRAFCDAYASAVADEANGTRAISEREELKVARAERDRLFKERRTAGVTVGEDQPQIEMLQRTANVDAKTARQVDAMTLPLLMQIVILFGGIAIAGEHYRGKQLRPWIDVDKWMRRYRALRSGPVEPAPTLASGALVVTPAREPASVTIVQQRHTDARFARAAAQLLAPYRREPDQLAA